MAKNYITKEKAKASFSGKWFFRVENPETGEVRSFEKENIIPDVFLNALAIQIFGTQTYDIGNNFYIALGTSASTPAAGDTILGAETTRKVVSVSSRTDAVMTFEVFFNPTEVSGIYREYGLFMDGAASQVSASADTGILASHVSQNLNISTAETLTLVFELTFQRA